MIALDDDCVYKSVRFEEVVRSMEVAMTLLSDDSTDLIPREHLDVGGGNHVLYMPAYHPSIGFGAKICTVFSDRTREGNCVTIDGLLCLFDVASGAPLGVFGAKAATVLRTAAVTAVAVGLLARRSAKSLAIIGGGRQAEGHATLLQGFRPFRDARIAARNRFDAERIASVVPGLLPVDSIEACVRGADVIVLCTGAGVPYVSYDWLKPGALLVSIGSKPPLGELDERTIRRSHIFIETREAFKDRPIGCVELATLDPQLGTELGAVILDPSKGRIDDSEIVVFKSMGHALEDLVLARLLFDKVSANSIG